MPSPCPVLSWPRFCSADLFILTCSLTYSISVRSDLLLWSGPTQELAFSPSQPPSIMLSPSQLTGWRSIIFYFLTSHLSRDFFIRNFYATKSELIASHGSGQLVYLSVVCTHHIILSHHITYLPR